MPPPHQPRLGHPDRMRDGLDLADDLLGIARDFLELLLHNQPALQLRVMRGDPRGAGVLVALQRLNTAEART